MADDDDIDDLIDESPAEVGSPCGECENGTDPEPEPTVKIRFALFYDGTLNNRRNTTLNRTLGTNRGDSYLNDHSNIAKLETLCEDHSGVDHTFSIYTEGIGTFNNRDDSNFPGAALGTGDYGVLPKVNKGLDAAVARIRRLSITDPVDFVHVDAFGFSRGAAAARTAVYYVVNRLLGRLTGIGLSVGEVKVKFVGLYDTVASYGAYHGDDTRQLQLDAVSHAEKVVQLAAAEEHRANFRLTNINSAGDNGKQYFLPGVHSDIGGGYVDGADEDDLLLFYIRRVLVDRIEDQYFERERSWFIDRGWYTADELTEPRTTFNHHLTANKTGIDNKYARIPLKMLARHATEGGVNFSGRLTSSGTYRVPSALTGVETIIEDGIAAGRSSGPSYYLNRSRATWHKNLRHNYLHMSAHYGSSVGAHDPEFTADQVSGVRRRTIQNG